MALRSPGIGDLEGLVDELVHRKLEAAEEAVERWGSRGGFDAGGGGVSDSPELAAAVRELISLSSDGGSSGQRAKMALQATMVHLEDEFRQVLISSTYFLPPDSLQACLHDSIALPARSFSFSSFPNLEALSISSFAASTDDSRTNCSGFTRYSMSMEKVHLYLIDPEASILLKETAELIILAGHAPNLCHVYSETRHNTLVQCLCLLGVQSEHAAVLLKMDATCSWIVTKSNCGSKDSKYLLAQYFLRSATLVLIFLGATAWLNRIVSPEQPHVVFNNCLRLEAQ